MSLETVAAAAAAYLVVGMLFVLSRRAAKGSASDRRTQLARLASFDHPDFGTSTGHLASAVNLASEESAR